MNKRIITIVIVIFSFMLIIPLNISTCSMNFSNINEGKSLSNSENINNVTSFHSKILGSKYWYVIKVTFSEEINITVEHYSTLTSENSSKNFFFDIYNDAEFNPYLYFLNTWTLSPKPDRYLKAHIGRWNCSRQHEYQLTDLLGWDNASIRFPPIPASVGAFYITFISYTTTRSMEFWINTSSNASFTTTQGTDVFAYDRYDFLATINAGWRRGTMVINGQKEITIENRLFALFDTQYLFSPGVEALQYQSPTGENDWIYLIDRLYTNYSDSFYENQWWGTNGTWSFKVSMLNMGLLQFTPNVYLMGADIKLPE